MVNNDSIECPLHPGVIAYAREGQYGKFYSHKLGDGWCNGKPPKTTTQSNWRRPAALPPRAEEYKEAVETGEGYTKDEIDRGLKTLPSKIASQAVAVNVAIKELDVKKHELKVAEATATIENSQKDLNANEKLAFVVMDENVMNAEAAIIEADAKVRVEKLKLQQLEDSFDSVRKAANILVAELTHMKEAV